MWAIKLSFLGLMVTALLQVVIVYFTGSVALLADTIHNFGDAITAIPLWIAFSLSQRKPTKRFTYGFGRLEDLAGIIIVFFILLSAAMAFYESINHLLQPREVKHLGAVTAAAIIGFLGNEFVARFRIRVGNEIGSSALVADGYHARVDGITSLSVLLGAAGVWWGFPIADPLVGLLITAAIVRIVLKTGKTVVARIIDGVDPGIVDDIHGTVLKAHGVLGVTEVRVRWLGHQIHAEINLTVDQSLSVAQAHKIAQEVRHQLLHRLPYLSMVIIHVDPEGSSGEYRHGIVKHKHDNLPEHSH
jgi:cation diffusion facilitator family transporter